jgi:hypothetical protein
MFSDRALRVLFRISVAGLGLVLLAYAGLFALWLGPTRSSAMRAAAGW